MKKRLSISLDLDSYEKLKIIAKQEKRFISRQAEYWVRQGIRTYEKVYQIQGERRIESKVE